MTTINLKAFGKCILQSKLVDREALETHAKGCQETTGSLTAKKLAQYLVSQKALTAYQAKRLLQGRSEGFFLGGCRILDRLGEGGMGVVYLAQQERLDRRVALKVLPATQTVNEDALKRFYREARAAAKLKHANIVQVFDVDQQDDAHFIVMELVNGKNLSELLKRDGVFSVGESLTLIRQAAEGLEHAHANGVIHRDIKPANLVLEDTTLKILDLGLARHEADEKLTGDQTIMGTLDYMSPEQCQDTAGVDQRSDIYSLGCTLYHLLIGKPPFVNRPQTGKLLAHVTEPLPDLHQQNAAIPDSVNQIVQRMTTKQREHRYQSAAELIADLDILNEESNLQTFIAQSSTLNEPVSPAGEEAIPPQLSDEIPSLSDDDAANSNTVVHSPPSSGWNLALLIPVMAALVLAGVYIGIQMLKDQRPETPIENVGVSGTTTPLSGSSSVNDSPREDTQPLDALREESDNGAVIPPEQGESSTDVVAEEATTPAAENSPASEPVSTNENPQPVDAAMATKEEDLPTSTEKNPETSEPTPEAVPPLREPHETVLRSFTDDWQVGLVNGDILTLISPNTYELNAQIQQVKDLTIQGTSEKRALIYMASVSDVCWTISNCSLLLQHVDLYVNLPRAAGSYNIFAMDTADLTLSDVSITIMEGGRQTWEDVSVLHVTGAREWDVQAKGDAPDPVSVQLRRVFVRGPGALVRNSSSHSLLNMEDSILTGTGPVLHALHTTPRTQKHQSMELQLKNSTVVTQEPVVSIDCRPFELRPVAMRVDVENSIIATQMPSLSPPAVVHWLSPVQTSLIADAFGFVGTFNSYVGRGNMFVAGQANGTTSTICQFPQDWERQKLGQDDSRNTSRPRETSKRIVWQEQIPRDFLPNALAQDAEQLEDAGAPIRELEMPRRFRRSSSR